MINIYTDFNKFKTENPHWCEESQEWYFNKLLKEAMQKHSLTKDSKEKRKAESLAIEKLVKVFEGDFKHMSYKSMPEAENAYEFYSRTNYAKVKAWREYLFYSLQHWAEKALIAQSLGDERQSYAKMAYMAAANLHCTKNSVDFTEYNTVRRKKASFAQDYPEQAKEIIAAILAEEECLSEIDILKEKILKDGQ